MKALKRAAVTAISVAIVGVIAGPAAMACGPEKNLTTPFTMLHLNLDAMNPLESVSSESLANDQKNMSHGNGASIVGMWSFQFISQGNTAYLDGTMLDWGYNQWHSDGTEVLNSGGRSPAQGNFCLGVWEKTGASTYELNHFALNYDATTGAFLGRISVVEKVSVSAGGTLYSGNFVFSIYDVNGNRTARLTGQVKATRITVDTSIP
jgi:hypothetical protein